MTRPITLYFCTALLALTAISATRTSPPQPQANGQAQIHVHIPIVGGAAAAAASPASVPPRDPSFPQDSVMVEILSKIGTASGKGIGGVPNNDESRVGSGNVGMASLADTLTLERRVSLWWEYARDVVSVTTRLTNPGRTTLLVPLDSAMMKMSHKPHQNSDGTTPSTEKESSENIERFVASHMIPVDITMPSEEPISTLNPDVTIKVEKNGEGWKIQPGDIDVIGTKDASNGKILYLNGVIAYEK